MPEMDEEEEEKSFCYIEGTMGDKLVAEDLNEFRENVWFKMKPPKPCRNPYTPFVTTRQIDLVRALLVGPKYVEKKVDPCSQQQEQKSQASEEVPTRRISREKLSLNKAKSSVRFLSTTLYEKFD